MGICVAVGYKIPQLHKSQIKCKQPWAKRATLQYNSIYAAFKHIYRETTWVTDSQAKTGRNATDQANKVGGHRHLRGGGGGVVSGTEGLQRHWFGSISWPGYKTTVFVLLWSSLREKGQLSSQHMAVMRWNYSGRNEIGRLSELKPEAQWWTLSLGLSWSPRTAGPSEGSPEDSVCRHWWPSVSRTFELKRARRRCSLGDPAHRRCHWVDMCVILHLNKAQSFLPSAILYQLCSLILPSFLHSVCSHLSQKPVTTEHSLNWPMFECFYF